MPEGTDRRMSKNNADGNFKRRPASRRRGSRHLRDRPANFGTARCLFSKAITRAFYHDGGARATILVEMLIRRTAASTTARARECYDVRGGEWENVRMAVSTTEILTQQALEICVRVRAT